MTFPTESVDLIYLDPPFNSKRLYNAFIGGAQWVAFDDTWRWHEAIEDFHQVVGQPRYKGIMEGLRLMLGEGRTTGLSVIYGKPSVGVPPCPEVHREHLSPLRPYHEPLPQGRHGWSCSGPGIFATEIIWRMNRFP